MNELHLPPVRPLPPGVRERALRTVLATMDAPAPRSRTAPLLAAAAAVVVAVTVTTMVAVSGPGPGPGPGPVPHEPVLEQPASGPPIMSGDPRTDEALVRCADAVVARDRTADYPPTDQWRATDVLLSSPGGDTAIAINDRFACFAGWSNVWVSATRGTPAGTASITRLAPAIVVILNPQRQDVEVVPDDGRGADAGSPDAPVQLVLLGTAGSPASTHWLTVAGSYDGLIPEPAPIGVVVEDRPSQTAVAPPDPTGPR